MIAICPRCGALFEPKMATQSFCSPRCRCQANAARQQRRRKVGYMVQLAAHRPREGCCITCMGIDGHFDDCPRRGLQ